MDHIVKHSVIPKNLSMYYGVIVAVLKDGQRKKRRNRTMKATIELPKERMVTLTMTETEARELRELMDNTAAYDRPIVTKVFRALGEIL